MPPSIAIATPVLGGPGTMRARCVVLNSSSIRLIRRRERALLRAPTAQPSSRRGRKGRSHERCM